MTQVVKPDARVAEAGYHQFTMIVRVKDLKDYGVRLIPPTDPEFDSIARPLIGERAADLVLKLKPMLVIVANDSPQTIVSLSIVWTIRYDDGRTLRHWGHMSCPSAVAGLDPADPDHDALQPGARRIEAKGIVVHGYGHLDPYYDQFMDQFDPRDRDGLDHATDLQIELNAVIFKDGLLVGSDDRSQLRDFFTSYVSAQQSWLCGVRDALAAGTPVGNAFEGLERFQQELRESSGRHRLLRDNFFRVQTRAEVMGWRKRHSDAEIQGLISKLNLEPFIIRAV